MVLHPWHGQHIYAMDCRLGREGVSIQIQLEIVPSSFLGEYPAHTGIHHNFSGFVGFWKSNEFRRIKVHLGVDGIGLRWKIIREWKLKSCHSIVGMGAVRDYFR